MRLLITGDWQTRLSNLAQSEQAAANLFKICEKKRVDAVVVAGDLKHQYSPVDLRAIEFWRWFVSQWKTIAVLGNHDRVGLYNDHPNWMDILMDAGAWTFDEAGIAKFGGRNLYVLPFMGSKERWDTASDYMNKFPANPKKDVLVFHATLRGSQWNMTGTRVEEGKGIPLVSLHPERYRYCIGGDIHMHQQLADNVWYVGSPFAMDWGEANQQKYFCLITDEGIEWIPTGMPGWYDPSVPGFKPPKSWTGCRVRLKVSVGDGLDYGKNLELERSKALLKYPGAALTLIPTVNASTDHVAPGMALSEHDALTEYVTQTVPEELKDRVSQLVAYIEYKIKASGATLRTGTGVRFKRIWGERFLCFDKFEVELGRPGITVLTGTNKDWPGRSNGSGKSSLLMALPVALFGKTFKGQTADNWAQRGSKGTARVGVEFVTDDGAVIKVERTRQPTAVRLWVNNQEISAGGRSTDVSKDIETLCGYSWDVFGNVVYLGQEDVVTFLHGTPAERQRLLAKLQNLERFGMALKLVVKESDTTAKLHFEASTELRFAKEQLENTRALSDPRSEIDRLTKQVADLQRELKTVPNHNDTLQHLVSVCTKKSATLEQQTKIRNEVWTQNSANERQIKAIQDIDEVCLSCGQKVPKSFRELKLKPLLAKRAELVKYNDRANLLYTDAKKASDKANGEYLKVKVENEKLLERRRSVEARIKDAQDNLTIWKTRESWRVGKEQELQAAVELQTKILENFEDSNRFLSYVEKVLGRSGLPAHLSESLCPRLNRATAYASELFSDNAIRVSFSMQNGEPVARVDNPTGGERLQDQSSGESQMAALITMFGLRETSGRSNILVLDEPGDGLDAANAQAFAAGLVKMQGAWDGEILLISHNSAIINELAEERTINVVKENGVSRIE